MLLSVAPVSAILPVTDLVGAQDFYEKKLGLKRLPMPMDDPMVFEAGKDTRLVVYYRPEPTKAEHTLA